MTVKVSSKFQVVIPEEIRSELGIRAGAQMEVVAKGKIVYLVPVRPLEELQHSLSGKLDSRPVREKKDRSI